MDLGWLPILELRDYSLFKTIFKALYSDNWPSYLNLQVVKPIRHIRSNVAPRLYVPFVQGIFQHSAAMIYIELPANIRNCKDLENTAGSAKRFQRRALCLPCKDRETIIPFYIFIFMYRFIIDFTITFSFYCNIKQGPALYKEPWTGRAVSHFTLDTELSTSRGLRVTRYG